MHIGPGAKIYSPTRCQVAARDGETDLQLAPRLTPATTKTMTISASITAETLTPGVSKTTRTELHGWPL